MDCGNRFRVFFRFDNSYFQVSFFDAFELLPVGNGSGGETCEIAAYFYECVIVIDLVFVFVDVFEYLCDYRGGYCGAFGIVVIGNGCECFGGVYQVAGFCESGRFFRAISATSSPPLSRRRSWFRSVMN